MADRAALAQELASKGARAAYDARARPREAKGRREPPSGAPSGRRRPRLRQASAAVAGASSLMGSVKVPGFGGRTLVVGIRP